MGNHQSFTEEQRYVVNKIKQEQDLLTRFYFTGGTALSYLYLHHRHSDDLDFFSIKKFPESDIVSILEKWQREGFCQYRGYFNEVVYIANLTFQNGVVLKVDFGYYPYPQVEKGTLYEGIVVDSKLDIAINKLLTVTQRTQVKDFVDLYFLLKEKSLWDLIHGVRVKFNQKLERFILSSDFMKVHDFSQLPRMIKPLTLDELKGFFTNLAKQLAQTVVEN